MKYTVKLDLAVLI